MRESGFGRRKAGRGCELKGESVVSSLLDGYSAARLPMMPCCPFGEDIPHLAGNRKKRGGVRGGRMQKIKSELYI